MLGFRLDFFSDGLLPDVAAAALVFDAAGSLFNALRLAGGLDAAAAGPNLGDPAAGVGEGEMRAAGL